MKYTTQNVTEPRLGLTPTCSLLPFVRCTELFDGSTWSETTDVITAMGRGATVTQNATLIAGGELLLEPAQKNGMVKLAQERGAFNYNNIEQWESSQVVLKYLL